MATYPVVARRARPAASLRNTFRRSMATPAMTALSNYDYSADPQLQGQLALGKQQTATAQTTALEARRKLLLGFGSQELARSILGGEDPTLGAISSDPSSSFSTLANIARNYKANVRNFTGETNANNLFYSSYFGQGLGNLATDRLKQENDAQAALMDQLGGVTTDLNTSLGNIAQANQQAEWDAYQRALAEQQQYGYGIPARTARAAAPPPRRVARRAGRR